MYEYNAVVTRVIDGDTIDVVVDLGFRVDHRTRVRLFGIDTPETRTRDLEEKARGFKAKARLIELLERNQYQITLVSNEWGKYGRALATIYVDGIDINQQLILENLAVPYLP